MLVLVLEASTSAAKAMLVDSKQGILAAESESYTPDLDENGRQDTEAVWQATLRVGRKAASGRDIAAIAASGVWHSMAVCDTAMRPVTRTHVWTFTGASDICRAVRHDTRLCREIYTRTGCMPNITYQPYTVRYLRENGLTTEGKYFGSQAGYNFYRMTGQRLESYSMVSGMGFLHVRQKQYDDLMLDYAGLHASQLAPLADGRDTRPLTADCAAALGVAPGIPVVPPHPDGALNQLGSGAAHPGMMTFSVGTSAALRLSAEGPVLSEPAATWCYLGAEGWLCGAATAGACNCVNWLKETVLQNKWTFAELEQTLLDDVQTPVFLPFLFGERCPGWRDDRRGGFMRLADGMGAAQLFQAVCEGVLFNIRQCYDILTALCGVPRRVILSGGIVHSPPWAQLAADILDRPLVLSDTAQASLLGGAVLAMRAAAPNGCELRGILGGSERVICPREGVSERYRRKYQAYLDFYA